MKWDELPEEAKVDMLTWFNVDVTTEKEKRTLAKLYSQGKFHSWDCPRCNDRVCYGSPDNWDNFQGVQQPDYASYPGCDSPLKIRLQLCDQCRMHDVNSMSELNLLGVGLPPHWSEED